MKIIYGFIILILCAFSTLSAATIYVNDDAAGLNNGSSWANAYNVLQDAINAASPGDQIWVAAGRYIPTANGVGRGVFFRTATGVEWYGGFAGDETAISQRENFGRGEANETILSGDLNGNGVLDNTDAYHIILQPLLSTDLTAIVDGFSFVGANANHASDAEFQRGAAIYIDDEDFTIRNCTFYDNYASQDGGAIEVFSGSPVIENCIFEDNTAQVNGGAFSLRDGSNVVITNCLIRSNSAQNGGAAVVVNASSITFRNATITENTATALGGGIYIQTSGAYNIYNSILWGNTATTGNEVNLAAGIATLNYSLYSNGGNDVAGAGSFTAVNNNLTVNPLFADAGSQNYVPAYNSPLLDAGNDADNSTTTDIRGGTFARKLNSADASVGTIDIGAYEYRFGVDANIPTVTFNPPTKQTFNSLLYNGTVTDDGNLTTSRGFVLSGSPTPTIGAATQTNNGTGEGTFQEILENQSPGVYYARAWATNALGTTYSTEYSYTIFPIAIDGNQDGIPDSTQSHVVTVLSANGESYITLTSESGTTLYDVAVRADSDTDPDNYYPYGLVEFKINASVATVDLIFHSSTDLSSGFYKKLDTLNNHRRYNSATYSTRTIGGQEKAVVTLELYDGAFGDYDGEENGIIYDPGGPTLPVGTTIPVWDWWWVVLIMGGGWIALKRIK